MYLERIQDLSIYYWLYDKLNTTISIPVVDSFPTEELLIPSVSIEADEIDAFVLELGNKTLEQIRVWSVDVFAVNKSQRDEIGYKIFNDLDEKIPVYNYELGFPPTVVPQLGVLDITEKKLKIIRVFPELVDKLYYRCEVTFSTIYTVL